MARRLLLAASMTTIVVWMGAFIEGSPRMKREVDPLHVGPGSIAAGRAHTVMALPDGRVFAWGAGARGQLGLGTLEDRLMPTLVPGLEGVIAVSAGGAHSVALTTTGEVFAWGANQFGRLGDGTRKRRSRPVRVAGLQGVKAIAAGRAHTLALTTDGRVFAWGLNKNGQLGNGKHVDSVVPVRVAELSDIVAIAAGDAHSLAATVDGRLFAWGRNDFSALGDGTVKDRTKPILVPLAGVTAIAAGAGHSLAIVRTGDVYSWGRGAGGELGTGSTRVSASPRRIAGLAARSVAAGRYFSAAIRTDGRVVMWGANGSGQLGDGTLVRRLLPTEVPGSGSTWSVELGALHTVAMTTAGEVRSWGEGSLGRLGTGSVADRPAPIGILSGIPNLGRTPTPVPPTPADTVPPTIVVSTSPVLEGDWMTTPVTVTFSCSDDVEVASCTGPVVVTQDGSRQVTGTAVDRAGNSATASVVVNLDMRPPALSIASPANRGVIAAPEVTVTGTATDAGSGVVEARCNGVPAALSESQVTCRVPLQPGRNDLVLQATDRLGRRASTAVSVTRTGTTTKLFLTPATRMMQVNDVSSLKLFDEFGVPVEGASWSTSDEDVITLSDSDPPQLKASGLGAATITVEKDGVTAEALIRVVALFDAGSMRWTLPPLPDFVPSTPLFANRVSAEDPHLFTVESQEWDKAVIRAVTADGEVLWQQQSEGVPLMADSFGGVISGVFNEEGDVRALVRNGGGTIMPWRYESDGWLSRPAQAREGAIYTIESLFGGINSNDSVIWDKFALVIDGRTGEVIRRMRLAREVFSFISARDGQVLSTAPLVYCRSFRVDEPPDTQGPFVGSDGNGYLLVRRHETYTTANCNLPFQRLPDRSVTMGLNLIVLTPDGDGAVIPVYSTFCDAAEGTTQLCDVPVQGYQLMPDGVGGTLVTWIRGTTVLGPNQVLSQKFLTRVNEDGELSERSVLPTFSIEMIGQDGVAFTYDDGWSAMNVRTGETRSLGLLPNLTPLAASPDGGLAALDWETMDLQLLSATAEVESTQPFGLDWRAAHLEGEWVGLSGESIAAVTGAFADATRFAAIDLKTGQQQTRNPGIGIFAKTHLALTSPGDLIRFRHVSIRIVPRDWQYWLQQGIELRGTDEFSNGFFTIGAGSDSTDTTLLCAGTLRSDLNRTSDYLTPPWDPLEKLAYDPGLERALIAALLERDAAYGDSLPYACRPEENPGYYNSNSFARGLLNVVGLPLPRLPGRVPALFPGWQTPVPASKFQ